ncbi:hypothetical protein RIVERRIDER_25 [Xanthomonas phage RiverRider]|uniref:Uncharacterized protein n=1 Tax=Xanthomonas phage RiverRider TaxID=2108116 RepID=A0A2P1JUW6_9CAUD|nr:hypothetical protein HWB58_gp25 [Xanthomonas phage RiverRider]AVO23113.1 hypothetical protein RIVERRIDER_25 [Xanthomonas phage RiverRider]
MLKWLLTRKNSNLDMLSYGVLTLLFGAKKIDWLVFGLLIVLFAILCRWAEDAYEAKHKN